MSVGEYLIDGMIELGWKTDGKGKMFKASYGDMVYNEGDREWVKDVALFYAKRGIESNQSERSLRYQTRLNESEAMKEYPSPETQEVETERWEESIKKWNNAMMRNERNNGREDVFSAIDAVFDNRLYFDEKNDFKQTLKIYLQNKGK